MALLLVFASCSLHFAHPWCARACAAACGQFGVTVLFSLVFTPYPHWWFLLCEFDAWQVLFLCEGMWQVLSGVLRVLFVVNRGGGGFFGLIFLFLKRIDSVSVS